MNAANFGPLADGTAVYGACRPGHLGADVGEWRRVLGEADVSTVVCLLSTAEAARWSLPEAYADAFEAYHVPVRDRYLPDLDALERALDPLATAVEAGNAAAIHCNAGQGRTGIVGAAWLVREHGLEPADAIDAVESAPAPRSPREAVRADNASDEELRALLARL